MGARPSIAVLGSLTVDEIGSLGGWKIAPGGAALYVSTAASCLGADVAVISRIGRDYPKRYLDWLAGSANIRGVRREFGKTCRFQLRYKGGSRTVRLLNPGSSLDIKDLDRQWDAIHIGSVFKEVPVPVIRACRRHATLVSMDMQGLVREVDHAGRVSLKTANLKGVLNHVDLLKATYEEALAQTACSNLTSAISKILRNGPRWLVVTRGKGGAFFAERGRGILRVPAYPTVHVADPTGAGDVMAGGLLSTFIATGDMAWALAIGSALASMLVGQSRKSRFHASQVELLRRAIWIRERVDSIAEMSAS